MLQLLETNKLKFNT